MSRQHRENAVDALVRWRKLEVLQRAYPDFVPFLQDRMEDLGFTTDEIQEDIAEFLEHGPLYLMIQAQRGQAKTTITAIFAIWCLIHNPKWRILIFSAGDRQASEISTLIVRLIMTIDILECMRPDKTAGDRTSVDAFDLHHSLKGIDKSPSVACMGITSNLQGARADLVIADDVESGKNSRTAVQREVLMQITRDFTSICSTGRIVYLGTPQSIDSIYNSLPGRGFTVRIWPGRYPNAEQQKNYGDQLAPLIAERCREHPEWCTGYGLDGSLGKATSPVIVAERQLAAKELDQGQAYFQLQHMLLTALSDALRFPLKAINLVVMRWAANVVPMTIVRGFGQSRPMTVNGRTYHVSVPHTTSVDVGTLQSIVLYIDPAGGGVNGDETGWACVGLLNSNLYVLGIGGVPGGYEQDKLQKIADLVVRYKPTVVKIEKNMGWGAFKAVLTPIIKATCDLAHAPTPGIEDDVVSGQKELRIINTLEPIMGRGALIVHEDVFEQEAQSLLVHDPRVRETYSLFFQLSKITRDRAALIHDDRLDALAGACNHFQQALAVDQRKAIEQAEKAEHEKFIRNPLGLPERALRQQQQRLQQPRNSLLAGRIRRL